ncbi:MAG: hypothetical protein ABFD54_01975 [Armatimonadota bacterium]|nr:hypothetical protein [bacterium]
MYRLTTRLMVCGLILLGLLGCTASVKNNDSHVVPFISEVPGNVHLVYDCVTCQPVMPKLWIDKHIAELDKDIAKYTKQQGGAAQAKSLIPLRESWRTRYKTAITKRAVVEYWGTRNSEIWVGDVETTIYNGKYVSISHPSEIGLGTPTTQPGLVFVGVPKGSMNDEIPYLGFVQPGLGVFETKSTGIKNTPNGFEERRIAYLLTYNKHGLLTSILLGIPGCATDVYEFSDYSKLSNFHYPRTVRRLMYSIDYDSQHNCNAVLEEIRKYHVKSIDTKSLPQQIYNVDYPLSGVSVQDDRPEFTKNHGSVMYRYTNRERTLTETSAYVAERRDRGHRRSFLSILGSAIQIVAILTILVLIGRALFRLIKNTSTANS